MFPIHLNLGFTEIHFYEGIYFLISITAGLVWSLSRMKRADLNIENTDALVLITFTGVIIGGRLSHFLFWEASSVAADPMILLRFWSGGISVVGGIAGGITAAIIYCRKKNVDFYKLFAAISPPLLLGQAIGRVGCFLNGDAFGTVTSLSWGVSFPRYGMEIPSFETVQSISSHAFMWSYRQGLVESSASASPPLHPAQMYEALGDIFIMLIIFAALRRLAKSPESVKIIFFIHTGGYSLLRFFLEYIRADSGPVFIAGMSTLQASLIAWTLFSAAAIGITLKKNSGRENAA
jgi:phosphatidylglycerol:prolipoprotein diacylglycerol transferase